MESRYFNYDTDYNMLVKWWESWGWPAIPKQLLSMTGIIVLNNNVGVCAGWLYRTDSAVCWAENYIINKDAPKELRKGSIEFLIEKLIKEAKESGFSMMMSSVRHPGLIKKLLDAGCQEQYDTNMSNLARIL